MIKPIHKCSDVMKSSQQREGGGVHGWEKDLSSD